MRYRIWLTAVLLMVTLAGVSQAQLKIGDKAPELSVSKWVKGEPVDLAKGVGKNVYVVEFWATWCPPCLESIPHLTELQRKYRGDGLVVVGVSQPGRGESLKKVKRFVKRQGDGMGYTVAFDESGQTQQRFMSAVGVGGIPYAFLIDRNGQLVWHGHPGDPAMDLTIAEVVSGRFDLASARMRTELEPIFGRMQRAAMLGDWASFKQLVNEALEIDPASYDALSAAVYVYVFETKNPSGLRTLLDGHIETHGGDARVMTSVATALLDIQEIDKRLPDLALDAAGRAYRSANPATPEATSIYARALFEIGMLDRAIELQSTAVAAANGDGEREALEKSLDFYKTCKSLHSAGM